MEQSTTLAPPPQPAASEQATSRSPLYQTAPGTFNRLSQPFVFRLPIVTFVTGFTGFILGVRSGSKESGLRFRAENAHRLPNTQAGWYLYHKSKNYHIALGGVKEGFKGIGRLVPLAALFVVGEEGVDRGRAAVVRVWRSHREVLAPVEGVEDEERLVAGNKDFVSTMLSGLLTAGAYAGWKRMPLPTAVRLMKMGAKVGAGYGLLQDAVNLLWGRRVGYVEFIKRHTVGVKQKEGLVEAGG